MTPFIIMEEGTSTTLQVVRWKPPARWMNSTLEYFEGQVRELQAERSQGIITSVFGALMGSRHKTRRRQVTSIPSTPVTAGSATTTTVPDMPVTSTPPTQVNIVLVEPASELPEPIAEMTIHQPGVDSQLGLYIANTQVHNDGNNVSLCSLDLEAHKYLKNFNKRLNDKVYSTFKELFGNINVDSVPKALPKVSVYNNIITHYVKEINIKYGITLSFIHLEASEIDHWVKTFQVAKYSNDQPKLQQLPQPQHTLQPQPLNQPLQPEQPQQTQEQSSAPKVVTISPHLETSKQKYRLINVTL